MSRWSLLAGLLLLVPLRASASPDPGLPLPPRPAGRARTALQIRIQELYLGIAAHRGEIAYLRQRLREEPQNVVRVQLRSNPERSAVEASLYELIQERQRVVSIYTSTTPQVRQIEAQLQMARDELHRLPGETAVRVSEPNPTPIYLKQRLEEREAEVRRMEAEYRAARALLAPRRRASSGAGRSTGRVRTPRVGTPRPR